MGKLIKPERPDFDTWFRFWMEGSQLLVVDEETLQIKWMWRHRERPRCEKKLPAGHVLVSTSKYFKYCKQKIFSDEK